MIRLCRIVAPLGIVALAAVAVSAHLAVSRTLPADQATVHDAPAKIQVWFTQAPSPRVSRLELTGPGGEVPLGELEVDAEARSIAAAVERPLGPGTYEVAWRTAGADGHPQRGTFSFSVARPAAEGSTAPSAERRRGPE